MVITERNPDLKMSWHDLSWIILLWYHIYCMFSLSTFVSKSTIKILLKWKIKMQWTSNHFFLFTLNFIFFYLLIFLIFWVFKETIHLKYLPLNWFCSGGDALKFSHTHLIKGGASSDMAARTQTSARQQGNCNVVTIKNEQLLNSLQMHAHTFLYHTSIYIPSSWGSV